MTTRARLLRVCIGALITLVLGPSLAIAASDSGTLTAGSVSAGNGCMLGSVPVPYNNVGFHSGGPGSYSPTGLTGGKTVVGILDFSASQLPICPRIPYVEVGGFSSNPSIGWLTSVTCNGVTKTGSSATYTYTTSSGVATWTWSASLFGFIAGHVYSCTIVHS